MRAAYGFQEDDEGNGRALSDALPFRSTRQLMATCHMNFPAGAQGKEIPAMDRRSFLGLAAAGSAALGIAGRAQAGLIPPVQVENAVAEDARLPAIEWQMATSWPADLDSIFWGAQLVANRVAALTDGKFLIRPRAAGELAPGLGVLNAVEAGRPYRSHRLPLLYRQGLCHCPQQRPALWSDGPPAERVAVRRRRTGKASGNPCRTVQYNSVPCWQLRSPDGRMVQ